MRALGRAALAAAAALFGVVLLLRDPEAALGWALAVGVGVGAAAALLVADALRASPICKCRLQEKNAGRCTKIQSSCRIS